MCVCAHVRNPVLHILLLLSPIHPRCSTSCSLKPPPDRLGSRGLEITFTWPALPSYLSHTDRRRRRCCCADSRTHRNTHTDAHTDACQSPAPFTGMTDSATHHSMDQELKQFALGGFPGSPRRLLRSHLLSPLRSPCYVSPLLLLSFPLPSPSLLFPSPAPLSFSLCSPFQHCLTLLLSVPSLSLYFECAALPSLSVCLAHFLVELPFRSPARRLLGWRWRSGGGEVGGRAGVWQGGFSQPTLTLTRTAVAFHWLIRACGAARLTLGLNGGWGSQAQLAIPELQLPPGDRPRGHGQHTQSPESRLILKKGH